MTDQESTDEKKADLGLFQQIRNTADHAGLFTEA